MVLGYSDDPLADEVLHPNQLVGILIPTNYLLTTCLVGVFVDESPLESDFYRLSGSF